MGQLAALQARRPSDVVLLLGIVRIAVVLVGVGALPPPGSGLALASHLDLASSLLWLRLAVILWFASVAIGAAGGRTGGHTRHLAVRLAAGSDEPRELRRAVADPVAFGLSMLSFAWVLAILVLMVWHPA